MVREARFLSDDPGWVDPSRFIDDRDAGEAELAPPAKRRRTRSASRRRSPRAISPRSDPRRKQDHERPE